MSKLNLSMNLSASSANVIRLTVYTLLLSRELVPFTANLCSSLQKHKKQKQKKTVFTSVNDFLHCPKWLREDFRKCGIQLWINEDCCFTVNRKQKIL